MGQSRTISDELWSHLVKISELLKDEKTQKILHDQKVEIESLKRENQILKKRNMELEEKVNQLTNKSENDGNFQQLTQDTILSDVGSNRNDNQAGTNSLPANKQNYSLQRILLTQDTILSDTETNTNIKQEDEEDLDLTDASPIKSEPDFDNCLNGYTEFTKSAKRQLFSEHLDTTKSKKIKCEIMSDDPFLDISQVDDSQEYDLQDNNPIIEEKINLTKNPKFHRFWYPEDFIKNPEYERYVSDKATNIKSLPKFISKHYERQQAHIKSVAMEDFNRIATVLKDKENIDPKQNKQTEPITPLQDPDLNYKNPAISSLYKFDINKENLSKYLKFYPNLLRTTKVRDWDIEDSLSDDICSDFLLTQDVQRNNLKAIEKSQIKALRMLFQSCLVVEDSKQVGRYIFRNDEYNQKVIRSEFLIDIGIFKD